MQVDNGFKLVGGGRVYFAQEAANDFSNPYIYWQVEPNQSHPLARFHIFFFAGSPSGQPHLVHGGREQRWLPLQLCFLLCTDARLRCRPGICHRIVIMTCQQILANVIGNDDNGFHQFFSHWELTRQLPSSHYH